MSHAAGPGRRAVQGRVELAHFWQEGDGLGMLEAMLDRFEEAHPEVTVAPAFYENHGLSIKSRILKEDPPSVFVEWPGENLDPYDEAGALTDLSDLWAREGLADVFLEGPRNYVRRGDRYVGIPVDIHRMNNLFYHTDLVEEVGVDPRGISDTRELLEVLEQCADAGVVGLEQPMKNPWTVLMLFCPIVMGQFGTEVFQGLTGEPRQYESEIREAVELLDRFADLASADASFLDMVEANERFVDRDSVFFYQGDWVAAEYESIEGFDYGEQWDHVPWPGTEDTYRIGIDAMVASVDAQDPGAVETFLSFVARPEVQEEVNRIKGSIPPRSDVTMDRFPRFLREQYDDFKSATYYPAGHSFQVSPTAFVEAKAAMSRFVVERDVDRTTRELIEAYAD